MIAQITDPLAVRKVLGDVQAALRRCQRDRGRRDTVRVRQSAAVTRRAP
jgi:hypothetical protein